MLNTSSLILSFLSTRKCSALLWKGGKIKAILGYVLYRQIFILKNDLAFNWIGLQASNSFSISMGKNKLEHVCFKLVTSEAFFKELKSNALSKHYKIK